VKLIVDAVSVEFTVSELVVAFAPVRFVKLILDVFKDEFTLSVLIFIVEP